MNKFIDKGYFVDVETSELFELSARQRKQLEKKHPNWTEYNCDKHYEQLNEVASFFRNNGTQLACPKFHNLFVGFTV